MIVRIAHAALLVHLLGLLNGERNIVDPHSGEIAIPISVRVEIDPDCLTSVGCEVHRALRPNLAVVTHVKNID